MRQLETVSFGQLINEWVKINSESPSYRFGQHFINRCFYSDQGFDDLWNASSDKAGVMIGDIFDSYNWPYDRIPVVREVDL